METSVYLIDMYSIFFNTMVSNCSYRSCSVHYKN